MCLKRRSISSSVLTPWLKSKRSWSTTSSNSFVFLFWEDNVLGPCFLFITCNGGGESSWCSCIHDLLQLQRRWWESSGSESVSWKLPINHALSWIWVVNKHHYRAGIWLSDALIDSYQLVLSLFTSAPSDWSSLNLPNRVCELQVSIPEQRSLSMTVHLPFLLYLLGSGFGSAFIYNLLTSHYTSFRDKRINYRYCMPSKLLYTVWHKDASLEATCPNFGDRSWMFTLWSS